MRIVLVTARSGVLRAICLVAVCALCRAPSLEADLISHWTFDGDTEDAVGPNDGDFQGDVEPFFVEGFDGNDAIEFDGIDDIVVVQQNESLPLYNNPEFSIAMWVKGGPQPDFRVWSEGSTTDNNPLFNIGTQNGGTTSQVDLYIRGGGGTPLPHRLSTGLAFDEEWHHIAWVDVGGQAILYIDGVPDPTDFTYTKPDLALDTTTIGGILRGGPSHFFMGAIDDVRIYDHALTEEEILELLPEVECPEDGDTHCDDLTIEGPDDGGPGVYVVSVLDAVDDSDDAIYYTFRAESADGDVVEAGPQTANVANLSLTEGTWSITVVVDDDLRCDDAAEDAVCTGEVTVEAVEKRMISHWPFDGDTADAVGENDGIYQGFELEPNFVDGFDGTEEGAILFNGTDDIVVVEQNDSLPLYDHLEYSIAMWVKGGPQPDFRVWSEGSTTDNNPLFNIGTQNTGATGQVDLFIRGGGGTPMPHTWSTVEAFDDNWHHIVWVDANGDAALYIDGVRDATSFTYTKPVLELDTTTIGGILRAGPSHFFNGAIDDVRIFNYILSDAEILELARPGCPDVVQVSRAITPAAANVGETVEVTLTASNVTQATTVADTFPDGLSLVDAGGGNAQGNTVTFTFNADGSVTYTLQMPEDECPVPGQFAADITPECGSLSGDSAVGCIPPPCEVAPDSEPTELIAAFMFGALNIECQSVNAPDVTYTVVLQDSPISVEYDEARGYGYEALYDAFEYGDRGGYGIFGPFDDSPNDRATYTDCPERMYDSNIIGKDFLTPCDQNIVDPPDPNVPCDESDFGDEAEGLVFRVDVPNGRYRFVAAVGDTCCPHAHRILAEDGGEGIPSEIGDNYVVLVNNHDQSQQEIGDAVAGCPGCSVFARVGFDDKIPPPGDGIAPSPQFVNMDEEGFATPNCPNSPILEVTEGYIRIHQLQGNSNEGPGRPGNPDPNGGGVVMLELWRIEDSGADLKPGDVNGDAAFNISDPVAHLGFLFGSGAIAECFIVPDTNPPQLTESGLLMLDFNGDGGSNISDAVGALNRLFGGGEPHALGEDCVPFPGGCVSNCQ